MSVLKRIPNPQLFVLGAVLIIACVLIIKVVLGGGAPKVPPLKLFKTDHDYGCVAIVSPCNTTYHYVASGSLQEVTDAVYANLGKNTNYNVQKLGDATLYVTYRNADPNSGDITKMGFGIDFLTAPQPSDQLRGLFVPTSGCQLGATNCVEATIIK